MTHVNSIERSTLKIGNITKWFEGNISMEILIKIIYFIKRSEGAQFSRAEKWWIKLQDSYPKEYYQ